MVSSYNDQHITYFFTQLIIMRISIHSSLGDRHPQYPIFITDFLCQKKITSTLDGHTSPEHTPSSVPLIHHGSRPPLTTFV